MGCSWSMRSSASVAVLQPVLVFLTTVSPRSSKSTAPSCLVEPTLKLLPASAWISVRALRGSARSRRLRWRGPRRPRRYPTAPCAQVSRRARYSSNSARRSSARAAPHLVRRAGEVRRVGGRDRRPIAAHGLRARPTPRNAFLVQRAVQHLLTRRQIVRRPVARLVQVGRGGRVASDAPHGDAAPREGDDSALEVVPDLRARGVGEERGECVGHVVEHGARPAKGT